MAQDRQPAFTLDEIQVGKTELSDILARYPVEAIEDAPELNTPQSIKKGLRRVSVETASAGVRLFDGAVETLLVECVDDVVAVMHAFFDADTLAEVRKDLVDRHGESEDDVWETTTIQAYLMQEEDVGCLVICDKALTAELERRMAMQ